MSKEDLVRKTIGLYSGSGWKSLFVRIRFWDAPFRKVEKLVPKKGTIVELGCGEGLFSNFLGLSSAKRKIIGIEIDKNRVGQASHGLKNVFFKRGDVTKVKIPGADCIVLFHLLHHLNSFGDQEKVIEKCVKSLRKGGKIIIVEVDDKPFLKYLISWFTDHFIVVWLFERRFFVAKIFFRKKKEWIKLLSRYELDYEVISAHKGKPFSHVVFEARL